MTLCYTFRPDDEKRLLRIVDRLTMRMPFLIAFALVTPLFIFVGIALATEELVPGILFFLVGIGGVVRVALHLQLRASIKRRFRNAVRSSSACSWILEEDGIASVDQKEKMLWSSFSQARLCPEGLIFTGGAFAWIPREALQGDVDMAFIRQLIIENGIRYEEVC